MIRICFCKCILRAPHPRKGKVSCNMFSMRRLTGVVSSNFQPAVYIYILYILISSLDIICMYIYTLISDVYPTVSDRIPIVVFNKHSQTSNVWCIFLHDIYHKKRAKCSQTYHKWMACFFYKWFIYIVYVIWWLPNFVEDHIVPKEGVYNLATS